MDSQILALTEALHRKGIYPDMMPEFLKDIKLFVKNNEHLSLPRLNE